MTETPPDYSPGETTPVAPTLGPHAPSANVVSVRPSPDVTPLAAVPSTPPWLLSHDAPSRMPARFEFPSHAHGPENPEMPFSWPHCGHALHLGCVADLVADVRDLRCPTCRAPWPPQAADTFIHACCAHSVPAAQPGPDHDTTSRQYHEDVAPRPPPHILPFCCPNFLGARVGLQSMNSVRCCRTCQHRRCARARIPTRSPPLPWPAPSNSRGARCCCTHSPFGTTSAPNTGRLDCRTGRWSLVQPRPS